MTSVEKPASTAESFPPEWDRVVSAKSSWLDINLPEIWRYRDLIYLFVKRDFVATYKQTILGPLWFLIQPILSTFVFTIIFGNIAKLPTDNIPPFLFYLCGLVAWGYFADCLNKSASTFSGNASIFSKVYFPRLSVHIANAITNLITFGIQFGLFLAVLAYFTWKGAPIQTSWRVIVLPLLLLQMAMLGIGFGCIVSSLTTRYRDLAMLLGFFVQLWSNRSLLSKVMQLLCNDYIERASLSAARRLIARGHSAPVHQSLPIATDGSAVPWLHSFRGWASSI